MAAENDARQRQRPGSDQRFNEAAAHGRGKLPAPAPTGSGARRFNEAAAHGRGKRLPDDGLTDEVRSGFNEAAAHGRGKHAVDGYPRPAGPASMRPRRMAAENPDRSRGSTTDDRRFNEAAAHGRGKRELTVRNLAAAVGFNEAAAHGRGKRARSGHLHVNYEMLQ